MGAHNLIFQKNVFSRHLCCSDIEILASIGLQENSFYFPWLPVRLFSLGITEKY